MYNVVEKDLIRTPITVLFKTGQIKSDNYLSTCINVIEIVQGASIKYE